MGELFFAHHLKCCNSFYGFEISVTKAFKWVVTWYGLRQNSKTDFLVHGHTNLYMGSGGWDPYRVCQPNYFAWFVFYIGNGHFWTGDLRNFFLTSPKSKNIVTNFHSFDTGSIPYMLILASYNCNYYYILTYMHKYFQIVLAFHEGIGPE